MDVVSNLNQIKKVLNIFIKDRESIVEIAAPSIP